MSGTSPKAPVLEEKDITFDDAKKWCEEVRLMLFGRGLKGATDQLDKANVKIHKKINKLETLFGKQPPPEVKKLESEYKQAAIRLKHIQDEYEAFELAKKNADQNIERGSFGLIKWKKKGSKQENAKSIQNAEKGMNACQLRLQQETNALGTLATKLETALSEEKLKRQNAEKGLSKDEKKKHGEAETLLSTGQTLIKFFESCDRATAGEIAGLYQVEVDKDWYAVAPPNQRDAIKSELEKLNTAWELRKSKYVAGKKSFNDNFDAVQSKLLSGQEKLPAADLNQLLKDFYAAQDAALAKKWDAAGGLNAAYIRILDGKLNGAAAEYEKWTTIRNGACKNTMDAFKAVNDPQYTLLGLKKMSEVVAQAEKKRDYAGANQAFAAAKKEADEVLKVAGAYPAAEVELQKIITGLQVAINLLPAEAQPLAQRLKTESAAVLETFKSERHVLTMAELTANGKNARKALAEFSSRLDALKDPTTVASEVENLKKTNDVSPYVATLSALIPELKELIAEYLAYGFNPTADPGLQTTWEGVVSAAETVQTELLQVQKAKTTDDFDGLVTRSAGAVTALTTLKTTIATAVTGGETTLTSKRTNLQTKLTELQNSLKTADHLFTTATWHREATVELLALQSVLKSASCDLIDTTLARATELVTMVNGYNGAKGDLGKRYDALKDRLEAIIKAISDKDLIAVVPTAQNALKEGTNDALATLRSAGPGLVPTKYGPGSPGLKEIEGLEAKNAALQQLVTDLNTERTLCRTTISQIRTLINGDLTEKVTAAVGKPVNALALPASKSLAELEPRVNAEKIAELKVLQKRLATLKTEVQLQLEEPARVLKEIGLKAVEAGELMTEANDGLRKLRAEYERDTLKFEGTLDLIKKLKGVDKTEKKRLRGLQKDAAKAAKMNDWAGAARKIAMALNMAVTLHSDPQASEPTNRGNTELKKLNPRWKNGVALLNASVDKLKGLIETSCKDDSEVKDRVADVTTPFGQKVVARIAAQLEPDLFQQELLVLQGDEVEGDGREKDRQNKKKYREQALAKLRRVREIISRDAAFTSVMLAPNPWKAKIDAIQVMRALNDLDLNLQRSV